MKTALRTGVLVLLAAAAFAGDMPKYRITTRADKHTDFSRLKTYAWEPGGWTAFDPGAHERIVAAVDRELAALGFTKATEEDCDVTVVYGSITRTDVDLKAKAVGPEKVRPTYPVASLVILLHEPGTQKELFRARADTPIDPGRLDAVIDRQVRAMFARYPTRLRHRS